MHGIMETVFGKAFRESICMTLLHKLVHLIGREKGTVKTEAGPNGELWIWWECECGGIRGKIDARTKLVDLEKADQKTMDRFGVR